MIPSIRKAFVLTLVTGTLALAAGCGGSDSSSVAATVSPGASLSAAGGTSSPQPASTTTPSATPASGKEAIQSLKFDTSNLVLAPGSKHAVHLLAQSSKSKNAALDVTAQKSVAWTSSEPDEVQMQSSNGTILVSAKAQTGTKVTLTAVYKGLKAQATVTVKAALDDTVQVSGSRKIVTNADDIAVVVNKKRELSDSYAPDDLVEPNVRFSFKEKLEKRKLRKPAAEALEKLFALADKQGIKLYGVSGYRSYATQKAVFGGNVKSMGEEAANQVSARPGQSEHQTGLAIDVSSASAKFGLEQSFGDTKEGKWLAEHAHEAGFIIRFLKGKEDITGYSYEPWHIRYVGVDIATEIYQKGETLEEYFQDTVPVGAPVQP